MHDIGLSVNREEHESEGAKIILNDPGLLELLSKERLEAIAYAVREHRASSGNPETVLAKIISDADRGADSLVEVIRRPLEFGRAHFPELDEEAQLKRAGDHIVSKFDEGAYGKRCYFPETTERLNRLYKPIIDVYKSGGPPALKKILGS